MNARVMLRDGSSAESLDTCLRRLKQQLARFDLVDEVRKRRAYASPGERRRRKARRARQRARRAARLGRRAP